MSIAFIDLQSQRRHLGDRIERAIAKVLEHGNYIMGPEVAQFEKGLCEFSGARHAITCGNGTDALQLVLMAEGVGAGDAVFVPAFTFVATAEMAPLVGATPVFVDVNEETFNLDLGSLERGIATAKAAGLRPRMVIAVDLFGQTADYPAIAKIAEREGMVVVADAAQAFGASLNGAKVGTLAKYTTTSFFPAKPLGCYGDGGAVFTDDADKAALLRSLRVHGKGSDKYDNVRIGLNSRLDTLQAGILIEKLAILADEIIARNQVADRYAQGLGDIVAVPKVPAGYVSVWAQYTIRVTDRDGLAARLKEKGVPTAVYYPIPMPSQTGYSTYPVATGGVPVSERLSREVISLPMHPYLDEPTQTKIIEAVRASLA
ncbi:DegT/DnrJ/EryC1/StrS family aminotransferase [Magnetospirillum molischianum]|uniref:Putative aminotransferase DegT/DnrJ/EryC1/StrS family protein n=1 Tax=Magnetospirillum molischianum DSM 120 TaxID=1150626 RepID=H8FQ93_MAGML|nr:DegT/DnrJ/EryC1/StrS family aminotransferase [Magnetospirillum molischianum]CCG40531.1 putative aminotransferase; DegT/DnrJ/EryC1/StrS family protein [Magnetospirillum molischianum DSM 120]